MLFRSLTPPNAAGQQYLQRRPDGSCVHLGSAGCEVYEHRPMVCRHFDCRLFSAFGITPRGDPEHPFPQWIPAGETPEDQVLNQIAQVIGLMEMHRANQAGETLSIETLFPRSIARYLELRRQPLFQQLLKMSPAEGRRLWEALGVDETALLDAMRDIAVAAEARR